MIKDVTKAISRPKVTHNHGACLQVAQAIFGVRTSEFAREMGVSPQLVLRWRATQTWNDERIDQVCAFFGMGKDEYLALYQHALSMAVEQDCIDLSEHLIDRHPTQKRAIRRIEKLYLKIRDELVQIEGAQ